MRCTVIWGITIQMKGLIKVNKKRLSRILFFVSLMLFMFYERRLQMLTGVENILDMMLFYDLTIIKDFMLQLGDRGKEMYLILHRFDFLFICSFGFMQFVLIKDKLKKLNLDLASWIFFIPIATRGVTDILENIILDITIMNIFNYNQLLALFAYSMTFLKWVSLSLIIFELIYLILKEKDISLLNKKVRSSEVLN